MVNFFKIHIVKNQFKKISITGKNSFCNKMFRTIVSTMDVYDFAKEKIKIIPEIEKFKKSEFSEKMDGEIE